MMSDKLKKSLGMIDDAAESLDTVEKKGNDKVEKKKRELEKLAETIAPEECPGASLAALLTEPSAPTGAGEDDEELGLGREVEPIEDFKLEERETKVPKFVDSDVNEDYQRARSVTYSVQDACITMMARAMKLAAETENPRAFNVFTDLVGNVRGLNKDLMDMQKTFKHVTADVTPANQPDPEQQGGKSGATLTVPLGSNTANLLKMLEQAESDLAEDGKALPGEIIEDADIEESDTGDSDG